MTKPPAKIKVFIAYYIAQLAAWKAEQLREVERRLRAGLSASPDAPKPRPPGTSLH
jgi:hypothetical protein